MNQRIEKLLQILSEKKVEGCLIENPIDLFYLTNLTLSSGALLLFKKEVCLFVDGRYLQSAKGQLLPVQLHSQENIAAFLERYKGQRIAFDAATSSYERFLQLTKHFDKVTWTPIVSPLKMVRAIKDSQECDKLRKSAQLLWKGFEHIQTKLQEGVKEKELGLEFEIFCRKQGAERLSFDPIIAFGAGSAMPHYRAGDCALKKGDLVLIDIGVVVDKYCSDMTRVLFFKSQDPEMARLYHIAQEAQKAALRLCKSGTTIGALDKAARAVMKKEGVEELFVHNLGHGVGLEIHEFPRVKSGGQDSDVVLQAGMVITIEPGLYIPGKGGVRYEDTILITQEGYENFYP